ncbi:mitochondrial 3-hydroxyisobutyryl-CoA hydrolase, putative [Cordyceps militaris CM01]|uniref:3-hydroxyisobutyryl-CoA hydrolase n=1 Tax=Cordyceps militaris (strain CM01) TaxID=983644 RepID=G3J9G1_CORMM|nr:mitochondrial 3-hydroxyisobutyryl-CoA hydrolase, putative [Cordyceps militaris CM01]EGX94938.1 mitochondrial 3-hydroxyisobutyryl-CoA hydrolase, putative [Cordyceps militaris CM01]
MSFRSIALRAGRAANPSTYTTTFAMAQRARSVPLGARHNASQLSTEAYDIKELPGDEADDVVFQNKYGLRTIMLNRPKKLNSLNGSMIRKIVPRMVEWEKSDLANVVVMKGAGEKALCAGGDVAALAQWNLESADGWKRSAEYFALEYKLDHYIATYQKPYVAFMDGITMGGGVGLSIHAPFRVATEKTVFAMPETTIGFFPDVGASFFLPRMNGAVGTYLALTSERLTGANVLFSGVATHYLHSTSLPALEARLAELRFRDDDAPARRLQLVGETLEEFATGLPHDQPMALAGATRRAIDRCFDKNTLAEIIAALRQETGETEAWAQKQLATLQKRSPTAVHVALRQMRVGGRWDIAEAFEREHQIASRFMRHHDFSEGVTALLVRKETPQWQPASLDAIPASDNVAQPFFAFDEKQSLGLFSDRTFSDYPHPLLGVPSEREIKDVVQGTALTPQQLADKVVASRNGRQGIATIVDEIISRKVVADANGVATWVEAETGSSSKL